jgi:hypothetical protein
MKKADKSTVAQRIKDVAKMLINGNSREDVVLHCSVQWNIGERQTDKYIVRAKTLVEKSVKRKLEYDYSKAVWRYEDLYKFCIEKKDYKTAITVNKELTNLQGLNKVKVEHSGNIEFISNIPD